MSPSATVISSEPIPAVEPATPLVRFASIDALRGFAAVWVLLLHVRELMWVGLSEWTRGPKPPFGIDMLLGWASLPFRYGGWAVLLFFVISGYCIHRPNAVRQTKDPSYRIAIASYLRRRLRRIYPVLIAALLLTLALDTASRALVPADSPLLDKLGDHSALCFLGNVATLQNDLCPVYGSNVVLWSLGIEVQLYLAYLLVFPLFGRYGNGIVLAVVASTCLAALLVLHAAGLPSIGLFNYGLSWVIGACVAEAEVKKARVPVKWLVLPAAACFVIAALGEVVLPKWGAVPGIGMIMPTVLAVPFALAVWYAATRPWSAVWGLLPVRWLAVIGVFSYSLYAIHVPVVVLLRAATFGGGRSYQFWPVLPAAAVCIPLAYLFFLAVERWSLPKQHRQPSSA